MTIGPIRIGIGGWSFAPWRGVFYPPGLPQRRELEYAASQVTAIEINATYYGRQKPESFANWAKAVPDGFKFSVKASRYATNRKVLAEGADSIGKFLTQGFTELGDRLGPLLWQFMATKRFEREDFARFLDLLPETQDGAKLQHVLEIRHESFRDPAFYDLARARNMAIVFADSDKFPEIDQPTADFAYARLQRSTDIETGYDAAALDGWADRARQWATNDRETYVFFISGEKRRNPAAAQALIARIAL
ncbi:MAG TPA: DUF72 domain-containing protein [Novosphingobium sp.]|nr:DUF72 domain-containing protein [Novosphingobium sp.]